MGRSPWDRSKRAAHSPALSSLLDLKQGRACAEAGFPKTHSREKSGAPATPVRIQSCKWAVFFGTEAREAVPTVPFAYSNGKQSNSGCTHSVGISRVTLLRIACGSQSDERSGVVEAAWVWPLCCLASLGTSATTSGSSWKAECLLQGNVCARV